MKFREDRPLANVDAAVRKLLEIANGIEADHAGRVQIATINSQFVSAGGTYNEYSAAVTPCRYGACAACKRTATCSNR
jgi:hypothetical protein